MSKYRELQQQAAALEAEIERAREAEFEDALSQVRNAVAMFRFTAADVFGDRAETPRKRAVRGPKYRNPENGIEWSGMGREPLWIKGKDRAAFEI